MKKRIFVSFDFDNDKSLKELIIGQSRQADSPFEVVDHSLKESQPESEWEQKARQAIGRAEVLIVMLGPTTRRASGVLKEVNMANELDKQRFQIIGYSNGTSNWAVPGGGRTYSWNWENLKNLLS